MTQPHIVLGIETSCDETAVAIVSQNKRILANVVYTQLQEHMNYGGVVPEIAARSHLEKCRFVIEKALQDAQVSLSDITAVASATGPGLIGGLLVGMQMGKALAWSHNIPFISVNHLEAHALTARLTHTVTFPFLVLLVSGGHTQILLVQGVGTYTVLGHTLDDAVGEAFDKVAKILGVGYPGGPAVEKRAKLGNKDTIPLPIPMKGKKNCDFSLSGLKTRVRQLVNRAIQNQKYDDAYVNDMCAAFQHAVAMSLKNRLEVAFAHCKTRTHHMDFVVAGGVASNAYIRHILQKTAQKNGFCCKIAPPHLCTDNGAMIAWAGVENIITGHQDGWDTPARPRWSLESLRA